MQQVKETQETGCFHKIFVLSAVFFIVSFFGWILEVLFFLACGRGLCDRGFVSLPLCPVYGMSAVFTYLFLGLPHRMRLFALSLSEKSRLLRARNGFFYLIGGAVIATLCELIVGAVLDVGFGVIMWNYAKVPLQYGGYICLPFSLIWGFLTVIFMQTVFPALLTRLWRVKNSVLAACLIPFSVLFCADLAVNMIYSFYTRTHLSMWI